MRPWSSRRTAEKTLAYLHRHADVTTSEVAVSAEQIGDELNVSRNTANTAIHRLIDTGAISVSEVSGGRGYPTTYLLHRDVDAHALRSVGRVPSNAA